MSHPSARHGFMREGSGNWEEDNMKTGTGGWSGTGGLIFASISLA